MSLENLIRGICLSSFCLTVCLLNPLFAEPSSAIQSFEQQYVTLLEHTQEQTDTQRLHALFDLQWKYWMHEYPTWATYVGYPGQDDRWADMSIEAIVRRQKDLHSPLDVIRSIDRGTLNKADQINFDLFRKVIESSLEGAKFKIKYLAVNQLEGVHQQIPNVLDSMPKQSIEDYQHILARLRKAPALLDQHIELLKNGIQAKITTPRVVLDGVPGQVAMLIEGDPLDSALLEPFVKFPDSISKAEQRRVQDEAVQVFQENVKPAYQGLQQFLEKDYLPNVRQTIAWSDLPDGEAWYAYRVRESTTTNLSPQQIHDIGLQEVKRIRAEMEHVIDSLGFEGGYEAFSEFLRTDPQFYFDKPQDLLMAYRDIAKRADPQLIRLFRKLPRMPYGIKAIPAYQEKSRPTAYYRRGSFEAGRPGYFYANTHDLPSRPKWVMEALTLHEAVPGHHFQLSLALEQRDLPTFRQNSQHTAYVEGWGLYAESLGSEMGFYQDPYSDFGRLNFEMWRAVRLVVDTGIHALGWSRQQAIDYMKAHTVQTQHNILVEVDRYIVWPGQALAYKIGELKIQELRSYASTTLGKTFDIREFHDQLLTHGAVPLDLLEQLVKQWVEQEKQR